MKIKKILFTVLMGSFIMIVYGQPKPQIMDIYYQDLYLTQRIASISPFNYIKLAKYPIRQVSIPDNLTEEEKKRWLRENKEIHYISTSNVDTVGMIRNHVKRLKILEPDQNGYDTFIAIVDHENSDTVCMSNFKSGYIYYNQNIMKPDTVFSQLVYDIIKYRDPDFVYDAF